MRSTCHYLARGLALGVLGLILASVVGGAQAMELREALGRVYQRSPSLQASIAEQESVDEQLQQAQASYWRPSVSLSYREGYTWIHQRDSFPGFPDRNSTAHNQLDNSFGYSVNLPIFRGGRTTAAIEGANARIRQERARLSDSEQSALYEGIQAYADSLLYARSLRLVQAEIDALQAVRKSIEAKKAAGDKMDATATGRVDARISDLQAQMVGYSTEGQAADHRFQQIVGVAPEGLTDWPDLGTMDTGQDAYLDYVSKNNLAVQQANHHIESQEASVRQAYGNLLPSVSAYHSFNWSRDRYYYTQGGGFDQLDHEFQYAVGLQVSIPLYEGGQNYSIVRQSKANLSQSRYDRDDTLRRVRQRAATIYQRFAGNSEQLAHRNDRVKAADDALKILRDKEDGGVSRLTVLLSIRQNRLQAMIDVEQTQYSLLLAEANLMIEAGDLLARNLGLEVELFDPEVHLNEVDDLILGIGF